MRNAECGKAKRQKANSSAPKSRILFGRRGRLREELTSLVKLARHLRPFD